MILSQLMTDLHEYENHDRNSIVLCEIENAFLKWTIHATLSVIGKEIAFSRCSEVIHHPKIKSALIQFLDLDQGGKGSCIKTTAYLADFFLDTKILQDTIRNVFSKRRLDTDDAEELISI